MDFRDQGMVTQFGSWMEIQCPRKVFYLEQERDIERLISLVDIKASVNETHSNLKSGKLDPFIYHITARSICPSSCPVAQEPWLMAQAAGQYLN